MKHGEIAIHDLDFDYKLWKIKIRFYQDELLILKNRIESLIKEHKEYSLEKDPGKLLQNQREYLDRILNKIRVREQEMAFYSSDYPVNAQHAHVMEHEHLRNDMIKASHYQNYIHEELYSQLSYPLQFNMNKSF